ncbi:TSUP family transporter [Psychrosphaera sp. B3R10]|uniref:sulfite exporter TauE/SafE family protein n=1 Tax=unclassified Psychrosphaera TaxID=2641570 RepID=UPI001C089E32|nr:MULTISPECIES: TSUP family transporter [unclassified Psychrosphaera]MBU2883478.1 TSUP family transporter [Psychrosphaera sp. I2R16]MBU2990334.1 TSUP family transporter [Psychrosphaera sp. B3R10]MDO6718730.1 TSUP family transporter [Psychrosphaera sp. 1_MG-2023]
MTGLSTSLLFILVVCAFAAGFIDAIAGGGGLLTVPALLASGLPPHVALGTNKLAATFGSLTAAYTFYKKRLFDPSFWKISFWYTAIGSIVGTVAVSYLDPNILNKLLPILIGFSAFYALFNRTAAVKHNLLPDKTPKLKTQQASQGFTLGFYDGFAGPGTGAFWTVSNLYLYKMNILLSSGVARSMNFISNFFSLVTFIYLGYINWFIGISMGLFLMIGAYTGAHSAIHFGNKFIRPLFTVVVSCMALKLAFDAWF